MREYHCLPLKKLSISANAILLVQPGKHVALTSIWIAIASILTCYTIEPEIDENGKPIQPEGEWYPGPALNNRLLSVRCRFISRSKDVEASLSVGLT